MNPCQNCGKINTPETNFCRFCGTKYHFKPQALGNPYDFSAPRPYAWKTDEFQTKNEPRRTMPFDGANQARQTLGAADQSFRPAPLTYQPAQPLYPRAMAEGSALAVDGNYHCPRCGSSYLPVIERRVSTAGWVVFSVLLIFTFIFFWIGLLMKEDVAVCPVCRWKST